MPEWANAALLCLFSLHLAAFARLTWRRRQLRLAVVTTTFLLLVGVFALRLWAPAWQLGGIAVHRELRWAAWVTAAAGLGLWWRARRQGRGA